MNGDVGALTGLIEGKLKQNQELKSMVKRSKGQKVKKLKVEIFVNAVTKII